MTTANIAFETVRDFGGYAFVLGASDPEMAAMEAAIRALGAAIDTTPYILYAAFVGANDVVERCHGGVAYRATRLLNAEGVASHPADEDGVTPYGDDVAYEDQDGWVPVWVECEVAGGDRKRGMVIDHHRAGDPGYGRSPAEYWAASSIGQLYAFFEREGFPLELLNDAFGENRLLVAASDHCPGHAFAGLCPGVDPEALKRHRAANSAAFNKMEPDAWLQTVEASIAKLKAMPRGMLAGVEYAISNEELELGNHAQLISGLPMEYTMPGSPRDPRVKVGLLGGLEPAFVAAWMDSKKGTLVDIYGDPARGYAGGYLPS